MVAKGSGGRLRDKDRLAAGRSPRFRVERSTAQLRSEVGFDSGRRGSDRFSGQLQV
jgi:hypothetical protein